jgi:hypothetical protein
LVVLFLVTGRLDAIAQSSAAWITNDQQEQIVRRLRTVLPQGWTITQTALNRTPNDWYTLDNRGFEIDGTLNMYFRSGFSQRTGSAYGKIDRIECG